MPKKCDHCGESTIDEEEQVCTSCGIVVEGLSFGQDVNTFQKTRTPLTQLRRIEPKFCPKVKITNKKKPKVALQYGLSALKNLCHVFSIPAGREAELTDMLNQVYPAKKFSLKEDVATLAGCCLFVVQRRNNQSIPLKQICRQLGCTKKKFGSLLNFLKSWLSDTNPTFFQASPDEEGGLFSSFQKREENGDPSMPDRAVTLIPEVCANAPADEKPRLIQKTSELVKLANSCWLYTGRSPHSVVVACAFLCWKSMHPSRKKAPFSKFCSTLQVADSVAQHRVQELKDLLLKLGRKIPSSVENYVNEENVLFHLDRILENSETLRNDLLGDEYKAEEIDCKEYSEFRHPPRCNPRKRPRSPVHFNPDVNASDVEISDSEIDSYIISSSEKQNLEDMYQNKSVD